MAEEKKKYIDEDGTKHLIENLQENFLTLDDSGSSGEITGKTIIYDVDIQDNLTSTSDKLPLSANQGKVLNDKVVDIQLDISNLNKKQQEMDSRPLVEILKSDPTANIDDKFLN